MIKRLLTALFIAVILMGGFASPVEAAVPTSYESGIQVRNLTDDPGTIILKFYDLNGVLINEFPDEIAGNESKTYYQASMPVSAGFNGSVVIDSTVPLAALSNLVGLVGSERVSYAAYGGFSAGSMNVYLPILFKGNFGYNTFYYVQNTGSVPTDVNIVYSTGISDTITGLQPGQSKVVNQVDEAHTQSVFSATLTASAAPIAVAVVQEGPALFSYIGFGSGVTNPIMPLINQNNFGYFTGAQIQNAGGTDTIVTVEYEPALAGTACTETRTIPAGASRTFSLNVFYAPQAETDPAFDTTCTMGETFIGSAKVTANTENMELVAVVNQLQVADNKGGAYNALFAADGQQKVIFPLIMDRNFGYFTGWSIVNVGTTPIAPETLVCNVTGVGESGPIDMNFSNTEAIPVDGSWTHIQLDQIDSGFVGGATCVGPAGASLVGTSNQLGAGPMWAGIDTLLVSEGFVVEP